MGYGETPEMPRQPQNTPYRRWQGFVAAIAGTAAHSIAIGIYFADPRAGGGAAIFSFFIGVLAVQIIGLPVARRLAVRAQDTILAGFIWGAVSGASAGGPLFFLLLGGGLSDFTTIAGVLLFGAISGLVYGAFAGATLAWCGRRKGSPDLPIRAHGRRV